MRKTGKKIYNISGNITGSGYSEIKQTDNKKKNMSIIPQDNNKIKSNVISKEKLNKFVNFKFK